MSSPTRPPDGGYQPSTLVTIGSGRLGAQVLNRIRSGRRNPDREPPDETLVERRPLYVVAVVLAALSLLVHQPLLFIAGLLVFVVAAVPELWYRNSMRQLVVERTLGATRASPGDVVEVRLLVENRKPLPLPWLEVEDTYPVALHPLDRALAPSAVQERAVRAQTMALWTYQRLRRRQRIRATVRGVFRFGPLKLRTCDPFGILTRETTLQEPAELIVHPLIVPVERFGLDPHSPFGERKSVQRLLEDPLRVAGTRAYTPGDEPRRIHWKATARSGELQSKVYQPSTRHTLAVFLEVRTFPRLMMGYDADLFELLACAAASVASWSLEQGYATALYSNGTMAAFQEASLGAQRYHTAADADRPDPARALSLGSPRLRLPASSRPEQLMRILDGLAQLLPYYGLPMDQVMLAEQRRLPFGATIVYLGTEAVVDVPLIVALRQLHSHGHPVSLLLARSGLTLADEASETVHLSDLPVHYIGGRADWQDIVSAALGSHSTERDRTDAPGTTAHVAYDPVTLESKRGDDGAADQDGRRPARAIVVE
jgi:uncharacterized protein (DUF58 family)